VVADADPGGDCRGIVAASTLVPDASRTTGARGWAALILVEPGERRAVWLAFACHVVLYASYYILRPLRDTMATVYGVEHLQVLYTSTFVFTLIGAPLFAALASRLRLARFLPGLFWFWLANILLFYYWFRQGPPSRELAWAYYTWLSGSNLFMVSVFWSLLVDVFSAKQATRVFAIITAGASIGSIFGPLITRALVGRIGLDGLLLIAAVGFLVVIALVHLLVREKQQFAAHNSDAQQSTLDHGLAGNPFEGFRELFKSGFMLNQAGFMLLMTWIATVVYYLQTELVSKGISGIENRMQAFANIDLVVNIASAVVATFGLGRLVKRFGVTASLVLNPLIMVVALIGVALSPTVLMVQAMRVLRGVSQYAIARPAREMCFTVVGQQDRYKAKNVIDTVVYRFGDLSAAWIQAALRLFGAGMGSTVGFGFVTSFTWGAVALALGRRYEKLRAGL
jgi:ATP:ADP antiporter, AAA family